MKYWETEMKIISCSQILLLERSVTGSWAFRTDCPHIKQWGPKEKAEFI